MQSTLETSAGYIDSEYSDIEAGYIANPEKKSSPKFGSDALQWCIDIDVPKLRQENGYIEHSSPISRFGQPDGFARYACSAVSERPVAENHNLHCSGTPMKDEASLNESCAMEDVANEFRWWCDEQGVSDFSVCPTAENITPMAIDKVSPSCRSNLRDVESPVYDPSNVSGEKTGCSSVSSHEDISTDVSSRAPFDPPNSTASKAEWSSFMKPSNYNQELEKMKQQVLYRLGLNLSEVNTPVPLANGKPIRCDAAVQTYEDMSTSAYREYELKWLRDVNEILAVKLTEVVNSGKLMSYKNEQAFIQSLQSHMRRSQDEIDRLLCLKTGTSAVPTSENDDLLEELAALKEENFKLKQNVQSLTLKLQEVRENLPLADRARVLEQKLKEEKTSKKALMDDFNKTLGYMRLMKDRLKTLSHERKDNSGVSQNDRTVEAPVATTGVAPNKPKVKNPVLKGCIKRSNTTNCVPSKTERVKFAETSDVYYLPKRSNSELGPFLTDTNKNLPILPCKIRPSDDSSVPQERGGLMGFFRNIKQNFSIAAKGNQAKINILKLPNDHRSQTQRNIDTYKKHLHARGLV